MHHLVILNPKSGKKKSKSMLKDIILFFESNDLEYSIEITNYKGHAIIIASEHLKRYLKSRIYIIGGDGTINEVVNGILESNLENLESIVVLPYGSGNDWIKSIDDTYTKNKYNDINKSLQMSLFGDINYYDVIKINDYYAVNIVSVGLDANIVNNARKYKRLPFIKAELAYFISLLRNIIFIKSFKIMITIDEKNYNEDYLIYSIGSGKYFGGGMKVLPYANCEDGVLDVCHVKPLKRLKVLSLLSRFVNGRHTKLKEVSIYQVKQIKLQSKNDFYLQYDGELKKTYSVDISCLKKIMPVCIPK